MTLPDRIAIIANGTPPETKEELGALAACGGCVCCDRLPPAGAPPLLQVVGDLDTLRTAEIPQALLSHDSDQETNDLTKAVRWCERHKPEACLDYFSVTGRREDHTVANLALIAGYGRPARIFTAHGRFQLFCAGQARLSVRPGTPISFLSFVAQRVTVRGVVWPVENLLLDTLWRATLNRTSDSSLDLCCEAPLFVYQPWSDQ